MTDHQVIMAGYKDVLRKRGNTDAILLENCHMLDEIYFLATSRSQANYIMDKAQALLFLMGVEPWQLTLISDEFIGWMVKTQESINPKDLYSYSQKWLVVDGYLGSMDFIMGSKTEVKNKEHLDQLFNQIQRL